MIEKEIPIDSERRVRYWGRSEHLDVADDNRRIVKLADMKLYERKTLLGRRSYRAVHVPTGIESDDAYYASGKPYWATADCIRRVLGWQ